MAAPLGAQFEVTAPDLASLRVMYRRLSTLYEHQELACELLEFRDASDAQRRALVRVLRDELARTADRGRLLAFTYAWMHERRLIPPRERDLRRLVLLVIKRHEHSLAARIGVPMFSEPKKSGGNRVFFPGATRTGCASP